MTFKLNKIAKKGIAIGLAAIIALGATGCGNSYSSYYSGEHPSSSYSQDYTSDYVDVLTSNEFKVYDEDLHTTAIKINQYNYINFINELNTGTNLFDYAQYYGLDEALSMYHSTKVNKSNASSLLDASGKLDANKLMQRVLSNNKEYMAGGKDAINAFYTEMSSSDMSMIINIIVDVVNSQFQGISIEKAANTLMELKMFQKTSSPSNAYITNNLTFVYNPTMTGMYAEMQEMQGTSKNKQETLKAVITHETFHLLQYSASDTNDKNGIESGICRMYNVPNLKDMVPVDSLWYTWLLEAGAEINMADHLKIEPGTYGKKISYIRSYNLSRFNELDLSTQGLEKVAFNHTLEEAYEDLELTTPEEQRAFLNYLYSVEITQYDPEDFWTYYTNKTGKTPTDEEKLEMRMNIRTNAVKYLTVNFYNNLANAISEGKINDLDTVFYMMRIWELDVYGHLEYTKTNSLDAAKEFILWHDKIQNLMFSSIAESSGLTIEYIQDEYTEYNIQASVEGSTYENCNLNELDANTSSYIITAKDSYSTSKFCRNRVIKDYIERNKPLETETTYTK